MVEPSAGPSEKPVLMNVDEPATPPNTATHGRGLPPKSKAPRYEKRWSLPESTRR